MSGTENNIKIICSIRFSLLITIDRFYKLFLAEGAFVNRRPEMISPLFFIPLPPSNLRPFGAPPSRGRRKYPRESLPLEGAAERSEAGLASFLCGEAASSLPSPLGKALCREKRYPRIAAFPIGEGGPRQRRSGALVNDALETIFFRSFIPPEPYPARSARHLPHAGKALQGKRYSRFFIHPTQKRPSLTSGRFYVYYLLRETLIKSQNSISHVFSCNASSYSSLNSSLFASEYSLHCMKI